MKIGLYWENKFLKFTDCQVIVKTKIFPEDNTKYMLNLFYI